MSLTLDQDQNKMMQKINFLIKTFFLFFCVAFISGCSQSIQIANTNISIDGTLDTNKNYQTSWQELDTGVEYKEIPIYSETQKNIASEVIKIFKFAPDNFNFSFQESSTAKTISEWSEENSNALFISNGSYFDENNKATGILKIDGQVSGKKLTADSVGELVIDENGMLDILKDADISKYNNVMQSYPLLKNISKDSGETAPRTVVAKDEDGNILFIYATSYYFSLYQLQNYLKSSDLNITVALNLDGGQSSSYIFNGEKEKSSSADAVANVIIVKKKTPN